MLTGHARHEGAPSVECRPGAHGVHWLVAWLAIVPARQRTQERLKRL